MTAHTMDTTGKKGTAALVLTVGDGKYPCRASMGAGIFFKRATGHDISAIDPSDMEEAAQFIYCCTKAACIADGIPFAHDFDTFACLLDPAQVTAFFQGLAEAGGGDSQKKTAAL